MFYSLLKVYPVLTIIVLILLCYFACRMKWLTISGSIAAFCMALVLANGGISMFFIPLVLFAGGSILSGLNKESKEKNGRNAIQVLANGGIGICCLLVFYLFPENDFEHFIFIAYLISFSISICDTLSSEIGRYFNGRTVDIISFKPSKSGLSGGISMMGTIGGISGVIVCSLVSFYTFGLSVQSLFLISVFGFTGMILDSILGSTLQAKYLNKIGVIEEIRSEGSYLVSGYAWCNNDLMNLISNLLIVELFILMQTY